MKKRLTGIVFAICVLAQAGLLVYIFNYNKVGFMADEIWSYGLANSYYRPFLFLEDGISLDDLTVYNRMNVNDWIPGSTLKEYITVQPGERFRYDAVYHNQTLDHHPPLYYMLLHTVSSFFPDQFSWWYGFSLSLLFFAGTQIFLFLTARRLTGSDSMALLTSLFYGGGTGMLCTFAYIRQYSLLTLLCTAFVFFSVSLYGQEREEKRFRGRTLAAAAVTAWLAFFTHYYAIAFVGVFTFCYCVWLLVRRRVKAMFLYGGCMLGALLAFAGLYPAALAQMLRSDGGGTKLYRTATQIRMLVSLTLQHNFGFRTSYFATAFWNITLPLLGGLVVAAALLLVPFRKDAWCRALLRKLCRVPAGMIRFLRNSNPMPFIILCSCGAVYVVTALTVDVWKQGVWVLRYVCLAFPLLCMVAVTAGCAVFSRIPGLRKASAVLLFLLAGIAVVRVRVTAPFPYVLERYGDGDVLREITEGKRVLILDKDYRDSVMSSTCLALDLSGARECFFTSPDELGFCMDRLFADEKKVDYVLIDVDRIALTPEAERVRDGWSAEDIGQESPEAGESGYECTGLLLRLAGGGYRLRGYVATNTDRYYVLELLQE